MSAQNPQGRQPTRDQQQPGREQDPDRQGGREQPRREPNPGEEEE